MRLKAIPSSSGMAIAVSSRLCPSSYRRIKFCSLITFPHCVSTRSNVRASPIAGAVESSMPEGSSSTAAAFQKIRVILNWRMRRRIASTFQSLSSTTISMGNIIPQVCTPCDGTISSPSPCESLLSPSRPTILLNPVSATRIHSPRTVPLVVLTARTVLFCNRIKLLGKILKHFLQVDNRRSQRYHEDAGEDEKHQGKKKLHAGLGRHLFSCLHAAGTQRVCKNAERMGDRRAKTLGLHQHGDKLPDEFNIQAFRHAAPCVQTRLAGALLAIDDLELFRQAWGGDRHFLAHAHHRLVNAKSGFHADHKQVERIRQGHADICLTASNEVRENKVGEEEPSDGADQDRSYQVVGEESSCHDSHHRQEKLHGGKYFHMFRLAKAGKCELIRQVIVKTGNQPAKWLGDARGFCGYLRQTRAGRGCNQRAGVRRCICRNLHQASFHWILARQHHEYGNNKEEDRNGSRY